MHNTSKAQTFITIFDGLSLEVVTTLTNLLHERGDISVADKQQIIDHFVAERKLSLDSFVWEDNI